MDGESIDIKQARLQRLKELFPELFVESQLDWEKLKAAFGEDINFVNERYVLNWAGKSDAFKILQQPTTATLKPAPEESVNFDTTENLFIEGENLEVLKVLQKAYYGKVKCIDIDPPYNTGSDSFIYPDKFSEKKEDYLKRIGDKDEEGFLMKEGLFRKNSKDSGHYHSNWLSMMYPRLFLAKNLLRDDGVIFVHIDDNEVHNLRMVMNEIFGEENFVAEMVWKRRATPPNDRIIGKNHEYIVLYSKRIESSQLFLQPRDERLNSDYKNPDNDPNGPWRQSDLSANGKGGRLVESCIYPLKNPNTNKDYYPPKNKCWLYNREKVELLIKKGQIGFRENTGTPFLKRYLSDVRQGITLPTIIDKGGFSQDSAKEIRDLFDNDVFEFPKPLKLLKKIISTASSSGDIILDFFGGSGTTSQAVIELNKEDGGNRKFILVQMPERCDENSEAFKAGYKTIADIAKERVRRVIQKIENEKNQTDLPFNSSPYQGGEHEVRGGLDLGFKVFKLSSSNFKIWRGAEIDSEEKLVEQLDAFTDPIKPGSEKQNMLYELMLKAGYDLTSKVEYITISSPPILGGVAEGGGGNPDLKSSTTPAPPCQGGELISYYSINNNELIIPLDAMNKKLIEQIIAAKPQKVITLDNLFTGNDQLKTNTVLQMRDAGVDFKTI